MKRLMFPSRKADLNYVIHKHTLGPKVDYQLSIQTNDDELEFVRFPQIGKATLSDRANITRFIGSKADDTRSLKWLEYEGLTKMSEIEGDVEEKAQYEIIDAGKVRIGTQTGKYSELFFKGSSITDRWILRRIPNIFDKSVLGDKKEGLLFWKPGKQKSYNTAFNKGGYEDVSCSCPLGECTAKFSEFARYDGESLFSKFIGQLTINKKQEFSGIAAAEGTWLDLFGNKYIYTPQFITHLFNKQRDVLKTTDPTKLSDAHDLSLKATENIAGEVTDVQLVREPINHIVVNGIYKGSTPLSPKEFGLSYEVQQKSVWHDDFQAWIPFEATMIHRLSVVRRPACKICWINKVI